MKTKDRFSKRNKVAQYINLKDGSTKTIFHDKKFGGGVSFKDWWDSKNKEPKPNSKRQIALKNLLQTLEP